MESINLSKPIIKNITLFYNIVDESIFRDQKFVELMNILIQKKAIDKYSYAIYTDSYMLRTNLFIPAFHTIYLACKNNNVIIGNDIDLWVTKIFTNNSYFILKENTDPKTNYADYGVKVINAVKELL